MVGHLGEAEVTLNGQPYIFSKKKKIGKQNRPLVFDFLGWKL
jgi:hypothetical protein